MDPTCTEFGYSWHQCTVESCGQITIIPGSYVDPLNHPSEYREETQRVEPTCTESGNIHYWHCSLCDAYTDTETFTHIISKSDTVLAALGHLPSSVWTAGVSSHWRICLREGCGAHIDEAEHNQVGYLSAGAPGHYRVCSVCGGNQSSDIEAHTFNENSVCIHCGYEIPVSPTGSGGFDVTIVVNEPSGHLTYAYLGPVCTVTFHDDNSSSPATSFEWYLNGVKQPGETGRTYSYTPPGLYSHTVMCVFSNQYGTGSTAEFIPSN